MKSVYITLFGPQLVLTAASVVSTEYGSMAAVLYLTTSVSALDFSSRSEAVFDLLSLRLILKPYIKAET